jgi:hypothetical protein
MLKRPIIAFFVLLAFAMLQAHNFMPHQHHDDAYAKHSHQHDQGKHHDHDTDDEEKGKTEDHDSPFHAAGHNSDFGKIIIKPQENAGPAIHWADVAADFSGIFDYLFAPDIPPPNLPPAQNESFRSLAFFSSLSLRGPPAFIVEA